MSTISVSNILTGNATTDLTIATGNTTAGDIVILSGGGMILAPNSSVNSVFVSNGTPANVLVTNSSGFFVTGNVNLSSNTFVLGGSSNAASGYTILPNQLKMNWGVVVPNSIGSNTVSFSSAFTTNAYTVSLSIRASVANVGAANAKSMTFSTINTSTIIINTANNTVGTNTGILGVHYLAIGPA